VVSARKEPVWAREAPHAGLTRETIVDTAIALADAEGLDAVSIRRIAAVLKVRPMSLYSHVASKEDLLDLMHDRAGSEALLGEVPDDWRDALRAIAHGTRAVVLRHPWLLATGSGRRGIGPSTLRHFDESAGAVEGFPADDETRRALLVALDAYTLGHATLELAGKIFRRADDDPEWRAATGNYIRRELAGGGYPHLERHDVRDMLGPGDPDATFERGLEWLISGASLPS
jgi:AcrR family transcriptional regulator